jgi:hypothetical protein
MGWRGRGGGGGGEKSIKGLHEKKTYEAMKGTNEH